jgi:hypothetical protein
MARTRKDDRDDKANVVPLDAGAQQPRTGKGPTDIDCKAYDRLVEEVSDHMETTKGRGWKRIFGRLLRSKAEALAQLEFAEKSRDVLKQQLTIALVKEQVAFIRQPVDELNAMCDKWPLFAGEMPWRGEYDEQTGRVSLVWAGKGEAPERLIVASRTPPAPVEEAAPPVVQPAAPRPSSAPDDEDEDDEDLDATGPAPEDDDPFGN